MSFVELDDFATENDMINKVDSNKKKKFPFCWMSSTFTDRRIPLSGNEHKINGKSFPNNSIRNQKYSLISFIPKTLFEQFKYFINFYYLIISLSQLIPALKVGFLFTYIAPLILVVALSMMKEAYDDIKRMKRDKIINSEKYQRLTKSGFNSISASDICVGHYIRVNPNQRIPADMVLMRTSNETGASFIRTDQLDGETDWKLRKAINYTQELENDFDLLDLDAELYADEPITDIYKFIGNFIIKNEHLEACDIEPLSLEQTLWSSTVLAADSIIGLVIYTGSETRSVINTRQPSNKKGKLDEEVNIITIVLCIFQIIIATTLTFAGLFKGVWWLNFFRFIILIAGIIPISMRVNLDFAKLIYAYLVMNDSNIPGCIARNTNIAEDCGRISYLLSDKTGTLTQNDMIFKKLHIGSINFSCETLNEINDLLFDYYNPQENNKKLKLKKNSKNNVKNQVHDMILSAALCHNVSISTEDDIEFGENKLSYQAASPDEVALVRFTESVGVKLHDRTLKHIIIRNPLNELEEYEILECFPFSSARKRMGIILRNESTGEIKFFMKGADVVMAPIVQYNEWLDEECTNLAREGLRTLVFGQKILSQDEYNEFQKKYIAAQTSINNREELINDVIEQLEQDLELLGLTGVEDKLQENVKQSLETLRSAGIKIWMLTGDKRETATCISISSKLVSRYQTIYQLYASNKTELYNGLCEFGSQSECVLVIDGNALEICLNDEDLSKQLFETTKTAPSIVCCRCSPTQKAQIVELIRKYTNERVASIGDGGNDVSMIQAAHLGIGIEGKEGKQAALAADYSIIQFSHIVPLLLWHGRNSYQRSAVISQLIAHRGMIISFIQTIYSAIFFMSPTTFFNGMLIVGYSCWYTMAPVFSLVCDKDITEEDALLYPELYQEIRKGYILSPKTFTIWTLISLVQATFILMISILLISSPINYINLVSISFSSLIFVELINYAIVVKTWNVLILLSFISTFALYPITMLFLPGYYQIQYISTWHFWWKFGTVTVISIFPIYLIKKVKDTLYPRTTSKLH